jgi:hypothetical protein
MGRTPVKKCDGPASNIGDLRREEEQGRQAKEDDMRRTLSALVALAVVAVAAVPASAGPDTKRLFDQLQRQGY